MIRLQSSLRDTCNGACNYNYDQAYNGLQYSIEIRIQLQLQDVPAAVMSHDHRHGNEWVYRHDSRDRHEYGRGVDLARGPPSICISVGYRSLFIPITCLYSPPMLLPIPLIHSLYSGG